MQIKKYGICFWGIVTVSIFVLVISPVSAGEKDPSEVKVAVVNGVVITQDDFNKEFSSIQRQVRNTGKSLTDSELLEIKKKVLENLINRELLYQESQKQKIKIDEAAINEQLERLKKRFSSETEFQNVLSKMNLSESAIKSQFKKDMAIQQFIDKQFTQKVTVSDKESKSYYDSHPNLFKQPEQVRASHILIKVDPQSNKMQRAEAQKKIEEIQQRLKKGEDFAVLAKEFSQCPSSVRGGDLGYFKRGQMVKAFEEAAFALNPGEISDIVETKFGYHLIKVNDKRAETTISYEDIKDMLERYLKQDKIQKEIGLYVKKLKEKAKIETFLLDSDI